MSFAPTYVNSDTEIAEGYTHYLIDATNNNITLTLNADQNNDGYYFLLKRIDQSSNTVVLQINPSNLQQYLIQHVGDTTKSLDLGTGQRLELMGWVQWDPTDTFVVTNNYYIIG